VGCDWAARVHEVSDEMLHGHSDVAFCGPKSAFDMLCDPAIVPSLRTRVQERGLWYCLRQEEDHRRWPCAYDTAGAEREALLASMGTSLQ
jgi:hypothetical protein